MQYSAVEAHIKERGGWAWALCVMLLCAIASTSRADKPAYYYDIPSGSLNVALKLFAEQGQLQIAYTPVQVTGLKTRGLRGYLTPSDAMDKLLEGTGLVYRFDGNDTVVVLNLSSSTAATISQGAASTQKPLLTAAQAAALPKVSNAHPPDSERADDSRKESSASPEYEEVVVSARKRGDEKASDVPVSMTTLTGSEIKNRGFVGMSDYLATLPGVSYLDRGPANNSIIIRGIETSPNENSRSIVGIYIGETTVTGLGGNGGIGHPDLKLVDIERVELLPGPQGTLYGDSSMGGTLRIIPAKPKVARFEGSFGGAYSNTGNASDDNYDLQAIVNIPLVDDKLALRVVGYRYDNAGFLDNIAGSSSDKQQWKSVWGGDTPVGNAGGDTYTGGRISALWRPADSLALSLMYLRQKIAQQGGQVRQLALGKFEQSRWGGETASNDLQLMNFEVDYGFKKVSLVSSTAWVDSASTRNADLGDFVGPILRVADIPVFQLTEDHPTSFTQELRLASKLDGRFQWLAGFFYQDWKIGGGENRSGIDVNWEGDPARDPFLGTELLFTDSEVQTKQKAFFGELSFDITHSLTATVGTRYYDFTRSGRLLGNGVFIGPTDRSFAIENHGQIGRANLSYRYSDNVLLFATYSEGFRLGGPHSVIPNACIDANGLVAGLGIRPPTQIGSDKTENWEVGGKVTAMNGRFQLNSTVYRIDWVNIPVLLQAACGFTISVNAGKASSTGVEVGGTLALSAAIRANYSASYVDAKLTKDLPPAGVDGNRLPGSPQLNASLGLQWDFVLASRKSFVRADVVHVGDYYLDLPQQATPKLGDYTTIGFRGGMYFDNISVNVYAQNLGNEYAFLWTTGRGTANILRPRTVGVQFGYSF